MGKLKARDLSGAVVHRHHQFHHHHQHHQFDSSESPRVDVESSRTISRCGETETRMYVNLDQILWKYRAEGNANLVLAIPKTRQVLRLKKVNVEDPGEPRGDAKENLQFLKSVVDYIKDISNLIQEEFIIDPRLVILLIKDMDAFNKQLNQYRPVERLEKEIRFPFGIIYPDVTFLPTYLTANRETGPIFCVEIKPKQGWRFNGSRGDEDQFEKLFQVDRAQLGKCRYCAMQYLKYKKGKIHSLSNYCPLDLFSGHPAKMNKAIKNLIDCPQNNLRMFRNGDQVYGDQQYLNADRLHNCLEEIFGSKDRQRNLHQFTHLLSKILLKEYSSPQRQQQQGQQQREGNLPVNCVLQQILNVQRLVYDFFASIDLNEVSSEDACDSRNRFIRQLLATGKNGSKFKRYQYGATALDCSLMITFQSLQRLDSNNSRDSSIDEALESKFMVQQDGVRFITKIAIMDLDPKPFTHAVKYVEQTQASYQTKQCCCAGGVGQSIL